MRHSVERCESFRLLELKTQQMGLPDRTTSMGESVINRTSSGEPEQTRRNYSWIIDRLNELDRHGEDGKLRRLSPPLDWTWQRSNWRISPSVMFVLMMIYLFEINWCEIIWSNGWFRWNREVAIWTLDPFSWISHFLSVVFIELKNSWGEHQPRLFVDINVCGQPSTLKFSWCLLSDQSSHRTWKERS